MGQRKNAENKLKTRKKHSKNTKTGQKSTEKCLLQEFFDAEKALCSKRFRDFGGMLKSLGKSQNNLGSLVQMQQKTRSKPIVSNAFFVKIGGEEGIRTLVRFNPQTDFESMRLLSTCLPTVPHSAEKNKATQGLLGQNDLKRNCSGRFEYYQHLSISLENPENRRDVRRDALLFFMSGNTAFEPIGNIFYQGVTMKVNEFELESLPETLSMEQIRLICHVSKLTARFYVKSGLIKNKNSGKQTRCYSVAREDFLKFIEEYKEDPSRFIPPPDWYKSAGHTKAKKRRKPIPQQAEEYCKYLYYNKLLKDFPDVMEVEEVAEITGYCVNTLRRWCKKGHLKPIMLRPKFLFPKPYVLELLTSEFYENISTKSYTHAMHLNNIYKEYTELHTEKENENEN